MSVDDGFALDTIASVAKKLDDKKSSEDTLLSSLTALENLKINITILK